MNAPTFQMLRVYPHLVYKSQLISESDMTVHLYAEGQERIFFKKK